MSVYKGVKNEFKYVSGSTVTREPIRVADDKAAGWKTLIVNTRGRGDVLMRYGGKRYPKNPSTQPSASAEQVQKARTVIE